jgi:hypothetical protein
LCFVVLRVQSLAMKGTDGRMFALEESGSGGKSVEIVM